MTIFTYPTKDFTENKQDETKILAKVIAIFDFEAQESTDLGFKKGEEIEVLKKDGDWWSGRIGPNRTGNFPFNYVKVPEKMDESDPLAQTGVFKSLFHLKSVIDGLDSVWSEEIF